ncbi:Reverse transcriptase domain [Trinorchestia longiramus]|nr:Reverse transcriptase domain [Trinorchestia longiramus]
MAIDFSKALDNVPHPQLIPQISSLPLNNLIARWLVSYLKGRSAKCYYHHHLSYSKPVLAGVPQGSVISPALFNLFVFDYPPTAPLITSYAGEHPPVSHQPSRHLGGDRPNTLSVPQNPGNYLLPHFTCIPHINTICEKARHRLNILKALASSSWGQQNKNIILTYKALINSIATYAAPIWFPNAFPSSIAKLQTIQNATLRIATGSHKMASTSHLHRETGILPVADHLSLFCSQYLLSSLRPHHSNYLTVT